MSLWFVLNLSMHKISKTKQIKYFIQNVSSIVCIHVIHELLCFIVVRLRQFVCIFIIFTVRVML